MPTRKQEFERRCAAKSFPLGHITGLFFLREARFVSGVLESDERNARSRSFERDREYGDAF